MTDNSLFYKIGDYVEKTKQVILPYCDLDEDDWYPFYEALKPISEALNNLDKLEGFEDLLGRKLTKSQREIISLYSDYLAEAVLTEQVYPNLQEIHKRLCTADKACEGFLLALVGTRISSQDLARFYELENKEQKEKRSVFTIDVWKLLANEIEFKFFTLQTRISRFFKFILSILNIKKI